jgi:Tfp pilus assembly protein FimV
VNAERIRVWAARLAAPMAFFLAAIVLVLIVQSAIGSEGGETETTNQATAPATPPPPPSAQPAATTTGQEPQGRRFYRVRRGDTLESIAERFETDVERLLTLNPGIDPLGLTVGQRLRVR